VCGSCDLDETCTAGACVPSGCVPQCAGKDCGDDGCGGSCGSCGSDESCGSDGKCTDKCSCVGKSCGDDGCGRVCGYCGPGTQCTATFTCEATHVDPTDASSDTTAPQECPDGQVWDSYAARCVLDTNPTGKAVGSSKSSGCGGGEASGLLALGLALLGLLWRGRVGAR